MLLHAMLFLTESANHREVPMRDSDRIRMYGRERYVIPARQKKQKRFSISVGEVVRELKLRGRAPAVCSALKTREFLQSNHLQLVEKSGPTSGQSTTVTYTYEFVSAEQPASQRDDSWRKLRGALKDVFAELGGGEAYHRAERADFSR